MCTPEALGLGTTQTTLGHGFNSQSIQIGRGFGMLPWWVVVMIGIGCTFFGMMLMALVVANGRDDPR